MIKGARPCLLFHEIAAIIAVPTLASRGCIMADWSRAFDEPISLPRGRHLVTLKDAANYIQKLPKAEQDLEEWQAAR